MLGYFYLKDFVRCLGILNSIQFVNYKVWYKMSNYSDCFELWNIQAWCDMSNHGDWIVKYRVWYDKVFLDYELVKWGS